MGPQLGQGANLALVDAWALACCVQSLTSSSSMSASSELSGQNTTTRIVRQVLRDFDACRKWRLRFYQLNSRLLTPVFQSNSTIVGCLRDIFMGPLCRFPLTRLQMLTVLCGAQNNGIPWTTIPEDEFMGYTYTK